MMQEIDFHCNFIEFSIDFYYNISFMIDKRMKIDAAE